MDDKLKEKFSKYAHKNKETLKKHGKSEDEFVKEAMNWAKSVEGRLELDKFILTEEIKNIELEIANLKERIHYKENKIDELNSKRKKKEDAISEIEDEIDNLN